MDGGSCLQIVTKALWVGALRLMWIVVCMSLLLVVGCWRRVWVASVGCGFWVWVADVWLGECWEEKKINNYFIIF